MRTFLMTILCLAFASCSTDINPAEDEMDYAEYNQKVITYLQRKYNVEAEVEFSPNYKQKLSKENIESFENFYKFIGCLKEKPMEMTQHETTRGIGVSTELFKQTVNYENDGIIVGIYYDVDANGKLADDPRIQAGLAGEGVSSKFNGAWYQIEFYKSDCRVSGEKIIADAIKGDYVALFYNDKTLEYKFVDGKWTLVPNYESGLYARKRVKITAAGTLDTATKQGRFEVHYAGSGTWFREGLGDL